MICDLSEEQPISPFIVMMNAGDGGDRSCDRPEEGPLGGDRSEIGRDSREPEVVVQSDGESVQVPRCGSAMHAMPEDPTYARCGTAQLDPSSLC